MAREFGKRRYKPEEIGFVKSGSEGKGGEPWTLLNSKLHKNILLEAYDNPSTMEDLAIALGVAVPYMEEAVELLCSETLLEKRNGKYVTPFYIVSRSVQQKLYEAIRAEVSDYTRELVAFIEEIHQKNENPYFGEVDWEDAKWTMLLRYADNLIGFEEYDEEVPFFVGQHGTFADIHFVQFKIRYKDIYDKTPEQLSVQLGETLGLVIAGKQSECEAENLRKLEEHGYLVQDGELYKPAFVVFKKDCENFAIDTPSIERAIDIRGRHQELTESLIVRNAPAGLCEHQLRFAVNTAACNWRGAVLEEAMRIGYISMRHPIVA